MKAVVLHTFGLQVDPEPKAKASRQIPFFLSGGEGGGGGGLGFGRVRLLGFGIFFSKGPCTQ